MTEVSKNCKKITIYESIGGIETQVYKWIKSKNGEVEIVRTVFSLDASGQIKATVYYIQNKNQNKKL